MMTAEGNGINPPSGVRDNNAYADDIKVKEPVQGVEVPVAQGIEFMEFKAWLAGYAAGVEAACNQAVQIRIAQLARAKEQNNGS
jgi:hypothetical protein